MQMQVSVDLVSNTVLFCSDSFLCMHGLYLDLIASFCLLDQINVFFAFSIDFDAKKNFWKTREGRYSKTSEHWILIFVRISIFLDA